MNLIRWLVGRAFALFFTLCRVFPLQKNKVVLFRNFPVWGSLGVLGKALEADGRFRVLWLGPWHWPGTLYHLATAGTIILNTGFSPLAYFPVSKRAKVVQLWHGDGALKRWGYAAGGTKSFPERFRYTAAICCGPALRPHWAWAFGIPEERVLPLGSPRTDALLRPYDKNELRARFDAQYPQCAGKRLVLYAPTFREEPEQNRALLSRFDFAAFGRRFGEGTALLVRLHPKMHGEYSLEGTGAVDVTGEPDATDLLRICDCLVTDYSSLMLDAAALDVPVYIYAFDYNTYMSGERGFYKDLRSLPPGPIVEDFTGLLGLLDRPDSHRKTRAAFAQYHLGQADGKCCERIIAMLTE